MTGFRMDTSAIVAYSKTVEAVAQQLGETASVSRPGSLGLSAFGSLGLQLGLASAYERAARTLQKQLSDGSGALSSAGEALRTVTERHLDREDEAKAQISKVGEL